jgi:hypothetical protein
MEGRFVIRHQDGDIVRPMRAGKVLFREDEGTWTVGLELKSFVDLMELQTASGEVQEPMILHLIDYPVGPQDPREKEVLEIYVPEGFDTEAMQNWVNFYYGEHFQTDDNRIRLARLSEGTYSVEWTCRAEDVDRYDAGAQDNLISVSGTVRVTDDIQYP